MSLVTVDWRDTEELMYMQMQAWGPTDGGLTYNEGREGVQMKYCFDMYLK